MSTGAKIYWAIFFILCLDFGDVGYNNFLGAVILMVYFVPAIFCLIVLAIGDRKEQKKPEDDGLLLPDNTDSTSEKARK